ncbi:MAG: DUF3267 domain-containing protein [Peptostreptococcaceae bacterium]|nr:DUF3267 domain-containing protein [Peptostreptococcaceae bacterium]
MNKSTKVLPNNYNLIKKVDFANDKKMFILINIIAVLICIIMLIIPAYSNGISFSIDISTFIKMGILTAALAALYIILHELVHGLFILIFTKEKPSFGFSKGLFYTATDYYMPKVQYIIIALAPVVIWGVVLHLIYMNVSGPLFWVFYLIQMLNISGAIGDYCITIVTLRLPKDILCKDKGASMDFYGAISE